MMAAKAAHPPVEIARPRRGRSSQAPRHDSCTVNRRMRVAALWLAWVLLLAGGVRAQTNERLYEDLDFRFVTPGARAIAMGKTFVGLADDATAAYSNPAGLSNLLEQEFSFEMNTNQIKHHRFIPSESGETKVFGDRVYTPSFFSYAAPVHAFTLSVFRNVVQDYQEKFQFNGRRIPGVGFENGAFGDISISAVNYGFGGSYLVNRHLSVGGSAVLSHLDVDTHGGSGQPDDPRNQTEVVDSGSRPTFIVGVLYKPVPQVSIGAVYNGRATFHLQEKLTGQFLLEPGQQLYLNGQMVPIDYVIPDRIAGGASWKVHDRLTLCMDVTRIFYSEQITSNFKVLNFIHQLSVDNYFIRDVTEIHAGVEYRFYTRSLAWAVRGGVFTDPSHPLVFRRLPDTPDLAAAVEGFRFNDQRSSNEVGGTFGVGVAISNRVQIDSAFSYNRDSEEIVLSFVWKL